LRRTSREHGRDRCRLRWTGAFLLSTASTRVPRPAAHRALASHHVPDSLSQRRPRPLRQHRRLEGEDQAHPPRAARGLQGRGPRAPQRSRPGARRCGGLYPQGDPVTASQHMIQANGLRFRVMADGPASGDLFVLLHGFPEGAESWSKQVDALAAAGALAVAPDMRGYGLPDAPERFDGYG